MTFDIPRRRRRPWCTAAVAAAAAAVFIGIATAGAESGGFDLRGGGFGSGGGSLSSSEFGVDGSAGQLGAGEARGGNVGLSGGAITRLDACPTVGGLAERQGCDLAMVPDVDLHVIDQAKSGACRELTGANAPSCSAPLAQAKVKVFDRSLLAGLTIKTLSGGEVTLTKNPAGSLYDDVYESAAASETARAATFGCVTIDTGDCFAGLAGTGDHLVILRWATPDTGELVYVGRPYGADDFDGTLATKELDIVKTVRKDGTVVYSGGSKTVVTGSYLEIVHPDQAYWEPEAASYLYPFAMTADSDWSVDLCAVLPVGYVVTGVYDEEAGLLATTTQLGSTCASRSLTQGDRKVVAFQVARLSLDAAAPEVAVDVRTLHDGVTKLTTLSVPSGGAL